MAIGTGLALLAGSAVSAVAGAKGAKKAADVQSKAAKDSTALQKYVYDQTTANYKPYLEAGNNGLAAYLYEMGLGPKPTFAGAAVAPEVEAYEVPVSQKRGPDGKVIPTDPVTKYRVGGKNFSTLAEAEKWANDNKVPGAGTEYGGYTQSPMAKYLMQEGVDSITGSAAASGGLFSGASMEALENNRRTVIGADTADYFSKLFGLTNMGMSAAGNQASAGGAYANNVSQLNAQAAAAKGQGYMGSANAFGGFINDAAGIMGYYGQQSNPMAAYASPTMAGPFSLGAR